jgi:hypothetical protein
VRGLAGVRAELLHPAILSNERLKLSFTPKAGARLSLPLGPALCPLGMSSMPKSPGFRTMPFGSAATSQLPDANLAGCNPLALARAEMLIGRNAFEIRKVVVIRITISMMDVMPPGNGAESKLPRCSVKQFSSSGVVTPVESIKSPIEVLGESIEHDRISIPIVRSAANLHPLSVKNLCSGVQETVKPSSNVTLTSGASLRVSLGL